MPVCQRLGDVLAPTVLFVLLRVHGKLAAVEANFLGSCRRQSLSAQRFTSKRLGERLECDLVFLAFDWRMTLRFFPEGTK